MKFKVGDKVRIVSERPERNFNEMMSDFLGTVMTVARVNDEPFHGGRCGYRMVEDEGDWYWNDFMIEGLATIQPSKLKSGMLVVLRNGQTRMVVESKDKGMLLMNELNKCCELAKYDDDFHNTGSLGSDFDIMEIYDLPSTGGHGGVITFNMNTDERDLLWERNDVKEMTMEEIIAELGYDIKIVE